ncbi:MAG: hypothetical protein U0Q22_13195 [Acidimicrobiales bacterium]
MTARDLLVEVGEMVDDLSTFVASGEWLDAYLAAATVLSAVDDRLHWSSSPPSRVASYLADHDGALAGRAASLASIVHRGGAAVRSSNRSGARLEASRDELVSLTADLADAAVSGVAHTGVGSARDLTARAAGVAARRAEWPAAAVAAPARIPSCFRSFDQQPADISALVNRFSVATPDRDLPVVVCGVRTSGVHLGGLVVAELRRLGYSRVGFLPLRPEERIDAGQRRTLDTIASRGVALVIDDPPASGGSIAGVARLLEGQGIPRDRIVLLLATENDDDALPATLDRWPKVILPWGDWAVHRQLSADAVGVALDELGCVVTGLSAIASPVPVGPGCLAPTRREHQRVAFAAERAGRAGTVLVERTGVGFYGRHAGVVAEALGNLVPEVLGWRDGVLYQWLDAGPDVPGEAMADTIAAYVDARRRALRVTRDLTPRLWGRQAVWEVAAELIGAGLGRFDAPMRLPVTNVLVRRALAVDSPSIVDGRVAPGRWVANGDGPPVKVEFSEGAFSHRELWTYDPTFDLAAPALTQDGTDHLAADVRQAYEARTGERIDPERWLLHRLVHIWDRRRHHESTRADVERATGAALWDIIAELLLDDVDREAAPFTGWCGLDVDGVVETSVLGTTSPGRLGGLSLRALLAHGYRPLLVTGRSIGDVARRSERWGLAGGVAEYGAAMWTPDGPVDLRTDVQRATVDAMRAAAEAIDGVVVDSDYPHIVRARAVQGSRRGPLADHQLRAVLAALPSPDEAWFVVGDDQTDLVPAGIDKGTGVRALLDALADGEPGGESKEVPLALAVGDSPTDAPLLALGELSLVPAHADPSCLVGRARAVDASYQAGLAEAVGRRIGHAPGACPRCAPPAGNDRRSSLLLISVREAGDRGIPQRLSELVWRAARPGRS